jgi:hypothetical protein
MIKKAFRFGLVLATLSVMGTAVDPVPLQDQAPVLRITRGGGAWGPSPMLLKAINGQPVQPKRRAKIDYELIPGPQTLTIDNTILINPQTYGFKGTRAVLDPNAKEVQITFEALSGHLYELRDYPISGIKKDNNLYFFYFYEAGVFDGSVCVSKPQAQDFEPLFSGGGIHLYEGDLLPDDQLAKLSMESGLSLNHIAGKMNSGQYLFCRPSIQTGALTIHVPVFSVFYLKPGNYFLNADFYGKSGMVSKESFIGSFNPKSGLRYKAVFQKLGPTSWTIRIDEEN